MTSNIKTLLLTGTALVATSFVGVSAAQAQVAILDGATVVVTTANAGSGVSFTGTSVGTGTVATGENIGGPVTTTVANAGTLTFAGASTVTGAVGATNALGTLTLGTGSAVAFSGAVTSNNLSLAANATGTFSSGGTITSAITSATSSKLSLGGGTFTATAGITGGTAVDLTAATTLVVNGATSGVGLVTKTGANTSVINGNATTFAIGEVVVSAGTLDINAANASIGGTGVALTSGTTLEFAGTSIAGNVVNTGGGATLTLDGANQTVTGTIGAVGNVPTNVNLNGTGSKTLTGAVTTTNLNIIGGVSTTGGTIAATNLVKTAAGDSTIANVVTATNTNVTGGGKLTANAVGTTLGAVTFDTTGGTVDGLGITSITGATTLTAEGKVESAVTNATVTNNSTNAAGIINVSNATSTLNTVTLGNAASVVQFGGATINGNVSGTGTLTLNGTAQTVTGTLDAGTLNLNGSGTKTLNGAVTTTNLNIVGGVDAGGTGAVTTTNIFKTGAGNSTINNVVTATNLNITGGGTLTVSAPTSLIAGAALTFQADGGTLAGAGGGNVTSVIGHSDLTGTGTVNSQVTNMSVANNSINGGTINIGNGASTLSTVGVNHANAVVQFAGTSISGAVTGPGTLTLNGANQSVAAIGAAGAGNSLAALNLEGTGSKTLAGIIYATTTNIGAGVTALVNTTINGVLNFAGAGATATLSAGAPALLGAVTTSADNQGILNFTNGEIMSYAIGTDAQKLAQLNLNNAAGTPQIFTFSNGIHAHTLALGADSTLNISGNSSVVNDFSTVTGQTLNINTGITTLAGTTATLAGLTTIGAGATLNYAGSAISGAVTGAGGALNLNGAGVQAVSGNIGVGGGAGNLATVNIGGAGTKTLTGELHATTVTFSAAGTADVSGVTNDVSAQAVNFNNNAGTLQYGSGVTYTGSAASTGGAAGTLAFANNTTVGAGATVGTAPAKIGGLTFAGGTNAINSSVYATDINLGTGTTAVGTGLTLGGNIVASAATLNPAGALTITGNLGRLTAMTLTGNLNVAGNATSSDTMNIASNNVTVGGTFDTATGQQLNFFVTPNANPALPPVTGSIVATGVATVAAGTRVNMTVDTGVYVPEGQRYDLITGAAGSTVANISAGLTTTNTALLHFRQDITETGKLVVYAARTQMTAASQDPNNGAVGSMLDALGAGGNADVTALQIRLANFATAAEVEAMLSTITPEVSGAAFGAVSQVGNAASMVLNSRIASLRDANGYETGMVAGDALQNHHFWAQAFGATADQGRRNFVAGYDADTYGMIAGVDTNVTDDLRIGAAVAYAATDVDSADSNRTKTDIDSYQASVYGDLDLQDNVFLTGQVSYMYGDIETRRHNVGGLAANIATADFHSDQYSARAELGRKYAFDSRFTVTPSVLANYSHIEIDNYSEKGAGGLSLRNVRTDDMDIFELGANVKAEAKFDDLRGGLISPNLHVGYRHDFIGDAVTTLGALSGGGAAFRTNGEDSARNTVNVGTGVKWQLENNLEFTANYDYEFKSDYDAHSGFVRAGYKF